MTAAPVLSRVARQAQNTSRIPPSQNIVKRDHPAVLAALRALSAVPEELQGRTAAEFLAHVKGKRKKPLGVRASRRALKDLFGEPRDALNFRRYIPACDHEDIREGHDGQPVFVSQPYVMDLTDLREIVSFCEKHDLKVRIDGNSPHYPGQTVRVEYRKREASQ
jgi:hypothetical protein